MNLVVHITLIESFLVCRKSAGLLLLFIYITGLFTNPNIRLLQILDDYSDDTLGVL